MQRGYPKRKIFVVGLAKGYEEALEVASSIIEEVYRQTGGFDVRKYLLDKDRQKGQRDLK